MMEKKGVISQETPPQGNLFPMTEEDVAAARGEREPRPEDPSTRAPTGRK